MALQKSRSEFPLVNFSILREVNFFSQLWQSVVDALSCGEKSVGAFLSIDNKHRRFSSPVSKKHQRFFTLIQVHRWT